MEEKESAAYPGRTGQTSSSRVHQRCQRRLKLAVSGSSYVKYMLKAMKNAGCEVCLEKHLVCEPCGPNIAGGYDPANQQIVLCENNIYGRDHMIDTLTHELIHSYDDCRAHVDWSDIHHLACSEIRAASLSGECFFWKENLGRFKFGLKKHHQVCARERAGLSLMCVKDITKEEAYKAVDKVFTSCFRDTDPFERVPP